MISKVKVYFVLFDPYGKIYKVIFLAFVFSISNT